MKVSEGRILNSAWQVFKQRGLRSSNLQQIARASSASLWDITLLFPSKKQLVLSLFRHLLQKNYNYLIINPAISPTAVAELASFFKLMENIISELRPDLLAALRRYQPVSLDQLKDVVDQKLIPIWRRTWPGALEKDTTDRILITSLSPQYIFHFFTPR